MMLAQDTFYNIIPHLYMSAGNQPKNTFEMKVTMEGKKALITITGYISEWSETSSGNVMKELKAAVEDGAKECEIYINSEGGSVFTANEILNLIEDHFDDDMVKVKVGALAASAATTFIARYHTTVKANTQIMVHKPRIGAGGTEDELEANLKVLKELTSQYRKMYAGKMGISEEDFEALWKNDYWMSSEEAKKKGFVDVVDEKKEKINSSTLAKLEAVAAPIIPKIENNFNTKTRMELEVLAVQLGLPKTATQAEVDAKIKALQKDSDDLATLKQVNAQAEAAAKKKKVKAILDKAEQDKVIDAQKRGEIEAKIGDNVDLLETVIGGLAPVEAASQQIRQQKKETDLGERKDWTYADWQEKDPEGLLKMAEEDNERFTALMEGYYTEE